ncbi:MAG: SWIM zinc finger family protein [Lacunisphaera sp.]
MKTAQGLAAPRKWTLLNGDGEFLWGLAQGSGANPYQVQIDLAEPAFKCSCPSRKFPCKHGLGLMLLYAAQPGAIPPGSRPEWVNEWVEKRTQKTAKQEAKATAPNVSEPVDPAAQMKRREKREGNITQGVTFLDGWLRDLVRQGFAATASAVYEFWDAPARRLVDAQAPGLARRVRELGGMLNSSSKAEDAGIAELGRLHLLLSARARREALPADWQEEVDAQIGLTIDQDELRQRDGESGTWFVGAQAMREEDKLVARTSYLFSPQGRIAKIMEFSPAIRPSVASIALGRWFDGELVFFPGVQSRRAIWKTPPQDSVGGELCFHLKCEDVLAAYAAVLAVNPIADSLPVPVRFTPVQHGGRWYLRDASGAALQVHPTFSQGWELVACAGGQPLDVIGLWDGLMFTPLTVLTQQGLLQLSR